MSAARYPQGHAFPIAWGTGDAPRPPVGDSGVTRRFRRNPCSLSHFDGLEGPVDGPPSEVSLDPANGPGLALATHPSS